MNPRIELLLWATRITGNKDAPPHELLEIKADASLEDAQAAFHKIAKMAHPDLHRGMDAADLEKVTSAYGMVANAYQMFRTAKLRPPLSKVTTGAIPTQRPTTPATGSSTKPVTPTTGEVPRAKRPSEQPATVRMPGGNVIRSSPAAPVPPKAASGPVPKSPPPPLPPEKKAAGSSPSVRPPTDPGVSEFETGKPSTSAQMSGKALIYYRKAEMALRQGDLRAATLNLKMAIAADPQSQFLRQALTNVEEELKKR